MKSTKNLFLFLIPLIVCICTMSLFIIYLGVYWANNPKRNTGYYCEISTAGWFIEPINTWSNLGFIIVGLIVAWQLMWGTFKENVNVLTRSRFMSIFFASLIICLGPCSMFMHATYTQLGVELDVLSEYLICAFLVAYSTQRFFYMGRRYFVGIFLLIVVVCELASRCYVQIPVIDSPTNLLVGLFILICLITELLIVFVRRSKITKRWGIASVLAFVSAFLIWNFSKNGGRLCYPQSWFQGHALWHVLCAVALYFLFQYYISENNSGHSNSTVTSF